MTRLIAASPKGAIHEIYWASSGKLAIEALNGVVAAYKNKYSKACACREKDRERLCTFCGLLTNHWCYLRTTEPLESTSVTVQYHRMHRTEGCGSRLATLGSVFQLLPQTQRIWLRLNGYK